MITPKKAILARRLRKETQRRAQIQRELIRREAALGGKLFGEIPEGVKREFVCVNKTTWIWHEESVDNNGHCSSSTTRYDVREGGEIYKMQPGQPYEKVTEEEATHLRQAAMLYNKAVRQHLYNVN